MNNNQHFQEMDPEEYRLQDMGDKISESQKDIENIKSGNTIIWVFIWILWIFVFLMLTNPKSYDEEIENIKLKNQELENRINELSNTIQVMRRDLQN